MLESAFLYSKPQVEAALCKLRDAGARHRRVAAVSAGETAPQHVTSWAGACAWRSIPDLQLIGNYHDDAEYVGALANSVREHWQQHGRTSRLCTFQRYRCVQRAITSSSASEPPRCSRHAGTGLRTVDAQLPVRALAAAAGSGLPPTRLFGSPDCDLHSRRLPRDARGDCPGGPGDLSACGWHAIPIRARPSTIAAIMRAHLARRMLGAGS